MQIQPYVQKLLYRRHAALFGEDCHLALENVAGLCGGAESRILIYGGDTI
jgi:hypothetical protein